MSHAIHFIVTFINFIVSEKEKKFIYIVKIEKGIFRLKKKAFYPRLYQAPRCIMDLALNAKTCEWRGYFRYKKQNY